MSAEQRFYTSQFGRFMSADRFKRAAKANDSGSWNKYSYAGGDPISRFDPSGRDYCDPFMGDCDPCGPIYTEDAMANSCSGEPDDPGPAPTPDPVATSCNISVASSGKPRDGQNLVGQTPYSPTTNKLGPYSNLTGAFFAVQIQGNLFGDNNPLDWTGTQTLSTTGTLSLTGGSNPIKVNVASHEDNPEIGINTGTQGRYDWLDEPGFPPTQRGRKVTSGTLTDNFTSTLTDAQTGQSCSVSWSVTFTINNGTWSSTFAGGH